MWNCSDRILVVILSGKSFDIGMTLEYSEDDIELFYEQMDEVLKQPKSQDTKIIMGDFNSKVGEGSIDNIVRPYGLG